MPVSSSLVCVALHSGPCHSASATCLAPRVAQLLQGTFSSRRKPASKPCSFFTAADGILNEQLTLTLCKSFMKNLGHTGTKEMPQSCCISLLTMFQQWGGRPQVGSFAGAVSGSFHTQVSWSACAPSSSRPPRLLEPSLLLQQLTATELPCERRSTSLLTFP